MSPRRWYRALLLLYPEDFRERYGDEMVEAFVRLLERTGERSGRWARAGVWIGASVDALRRGVAARIVEGASVRGRAPAEGPGGGRSGMTRGVISDVRYGLRALTRRPAFSLTAVAALALGVGTSAASFGVANGILLKPLPYEEPDRLVALWATHPERGWDNVDVNMADAWEWGERSGALADVAVHDNRRMALTGGDRPEFVAAVRSTSNVFDLVGVEPALGRGFLPDDNREGAEAVTVLTHDFWQARFAGDPGVVGRTIHLDDEPHTVVGVLPEGFHYADEFADLFVPWRQAPLAARRGSHVAEAVGRLAPGATLERLQEDLARIARRQAEAHPETNQGWSAEAEPLRDDVVGAVAGRASLVLVVASVFVLLMACVNVANLLLARADGRRREMAIRTAVGAGRFRIARQLLVEAGLLAAVGGGLGTALATWGSRAIVARLPANLPPALRFEPDWRVLAFSIGVTAATALLVGLLPALRSSRTDPGALRDGGRSGPGRRGRRFGSGLVVVQTAVAMVLLVAAGVLFRSVSSMQTLELGYEPAGVLTAGLNPPESRYGDPDALAALYDRITARARALPGVESAGWVHSPPLGWSNWSAGVTVPGLEIPGEEDGLPARTNYVSPGYLEAMQIEVRRGRPILERDRADAEPVVLVNDAFAERYLADADPLAHEVDGGDGPRRIVGVVENTVERNIDEPAEPTVFLPLAQQPVRSRFLVVKTGGAAGGMAGPVREAVWSVDPDLPLLRVRTMDELVAARVSGFRLIAQLMGTFALLALVLGGVGIYGVTAYAVSRRRNEIGVRVAMGAARSQVRGMVVRDSMRRAGLGLAIGMVLALVLTRTLESLLVGVSGRDPATYLVVGGVLAAVTFLAAYLPSRRASSVDPVEALAGE